MSKKSEVEINGFVFADMELRTPIVINYPDPDDAANALEAACGMASPVKVEEPKEGLRFNKGKLDLTQLSPTAQKLEAMVFMYGATKYARNNWKKFKIDEQKAYDEFLACAKRHIMAYEEGKWTDDESKQVHLAHAVWNLNRIMDLYYYGVTHGKDGKDLFHQPLREDLPEIPKKKE